MTPGLAARGDRTGVCIYPSINGERLNSQISSPGRQPRKPRAGAELGAVPQLKTSQVPVPEFPASCGFRQNHSPESEGRKARYSEPRSAETAGTSTRLFSLFSYFCAQPPPHKRIPLRVPSPRAPHLLFSRPLPRVVRPRGRTSQTQVRQLLRVNRGLKMRPKLLGAGFCLELAGTRDPAAVAATPLSATSPAQALRRARPASAASTRARTESGIGSTAVSGPSAGARRASMAGSEAGTRRASAFSPAVQGMPSPYPTTRMRRGLASYSKGRPLVPSHWLGDWKGDENLDGTGCLHRPAAWGVQPRAHPPLFGSWRKANWPRPWRRTSRTRAAAGRRRPRRIQAPAGTQFHPPPAAKSRSAAPLGLFFHVARPTSLVPRLPSVGRARGPLFAPVAAETCALPVPPHKATAVPGEGGGLRVGAARCPPEPALVRGASHREMGGQRGQFCQRRDQDLASPKTILGVGGASDGTCLSSSLGEVSSSSPRATREAW